MSEQDADLARSQRWLDSCRAFVVTCQQQLEQAMRQLEKAEERVRELDEVVSRG
jgi:hypothetical protein